MSEADERMYRNIICNLIKPDDCTRTVSSSVHFQIGKQAKTDLAEAREKRLFHAAEPALTQLFLEYLTDADQIDRYLSNEEDPELISFRESFVRLTTADECDWIRETLPELIDLIRNTGELCDAAGKELFERIDAMYEDICDRLLNGKPFREVTAVVMDGGDLHNHGRSAAIITTDTGRFVYKPHSMGIDALAGDMIDRFFGDVMKAPKVCCAEDYGFAEFIGNHPANTEESAEQYFHNLGGLAAMVLMLGSNDLHHTNVLSKGCYPIIIDYELMMTPGRGISKEGYDREIADSLLYSSLMPSRHGDVESSILFAADEENQSAPVIDGIRKTVLDEPDAFLTGFRMVYRRIVRQKEELKGYLRSAEPVSVRHILRGTDAYTILLEKLHSPAWLKDHDVRPALNEELNRAMARSGLTQADKIITSECDALLRGDIPYFFIRTDSRDLFADGTAVYPDYFRNTCIDHICERIDRMNEAELAFEEALLKKAMTRVIRRVPVTGEVCEPVAGNRTRSAEELQSHAETIFTGILQDAVRTPSGELCWFGPDYFLRSGMQLMNEGLMDGTMGLAVFFAALHAVTDDPVITAQSGELLDGILKRQYTRMKELSQAEVIYPNVESPSLSSGLAGKLQALVLIGRYLGKDTVDELIRQMPEVLLKCEFSHEELDVYNGLAGLLRVLCQYEELFTQPGIAKLCEQIADIIAGSRRLSYEDLHVWKTSHTAWPVSGAGHGQSGVSAALYSAGKRLNRDDLCRMAADGLRFERRIYSEPLGAWPDLRKARRSTNYMTGYCSGAPGIGLNALHAGYEHADWMIEHAIESVRKEPLQYKDYLCCGNSAAVEFLLEAGRIMNRPDLVQEANARMTMVIARAENDGHYHCVSRSLTNVYSPSLFYGTAGIGYEILRLAYPDRFEPVLL